MGIESTLLKSASDFRRRHGRYPAYIAVARDEWKQVRALRPRAALLDWHVRICGAPVIKLTRKAGIV